LSTGELLHDGESQGGGLALEVESRPQTYHAATNHEDVEVPERSVRFPVRSSALQHSEVKWVKF